MKPLYMDSQATTSLDPRVLDTMLPFLTSYYGNPHSRTHQYGWESAAPKEIIWTSGATESNNITVKGVGRFYASKKKHVITTQTEHKCVLDSCRILESEGIDVTYLPVLPSGLIDLEQFEASLRPDTSLVSVMMVNNEIGVIQPVEEIGKICRAS